MQNPVRKRGLPVPLGVNNLADGINFAVFSRHGGKVTLVIEWFGDEGEKFEDDFLLNPLENKTGDIWHIQLKLETRNFLYGWKMDGPAPQKGKRHWYNPSKILIDPFSRALLPRRWTEPAHYGLKPCCRIESNPFDWRDDRHPNTPLSETVIYEMHVRGFTAHPSSGVTSPGTFQGIIEKIPYLKTLGVTAVELMPVTEFDENDVIFTNPDTGERLRNFWGYNPVSFFALNSGYASDPEHSIEEFKTLVRALHKAGIEVFLDMVFNHSGEGKYDGTTSSFRGIDNTIYYILDEQGDYLNYSGCGNTVNCNHPVVRHLILDALRYWVMEMHVDGFRFDLASILGRDSDGKVLTNPPLIEEIGEDPLLRDTKIIAEAWDAAGLYQVGSFSRDSRWAEWNGRFRDDIRMFMTGRNRMITQLATRIAGSSDLYESSNRSPLSSINFITSHDGFTLRDLVSFDTKHNEANGEMNRDGDNHNLSWNGGYEGYGCPEEIEEARWRRMKTFCLILMISQGIPMILAGDEFGRSQAGNNNSWCQDNEISWLDWDLIRENDQFHRFFRLCVALRKRFRIFRRGDFFPPASSAPKDATHGSITWQYLQPGEQNWDDDCHGLAFLLTSPPESGDPDFFVMLNGHRNQELRFTAPVSKKGRWREVVNSGKTSPHDFLPCKSVPFPGKNLQVDVIPFGGVILATSSLELLEAE